MTSSSECDPCQAADTAVIQPHKKLLINRLSRISGQINGISRMVEQDRYCVDILTQIAAVKSALDGLALQLLEDHTKGCVQKALQAEGGDRAVEELMGVIKKVTGM